MGIISFWPGKNLLRDRKFLDAIEKIEEKNREKLFLDKFSLDNCYLKGLIMFNADALI